MLDFNFGVNLGLVVDRYANSHSCPAFFLCVGTRSAGFLLVRQATTGLSTCVFGGNSRDHFNDDYGSASCRDRYAGHAVREAGRLFRSRHKEWGGHGDKSRLQDAIAEHLASMMRQFEVAFGDALEHAVLENTVDTRSANNSKTVGEARARIIIRFALRKRTALGIAVQVSRLHAADHNPLPAQVDRPEQSEACKQ